jgi:uncharacterized protein (DUF305 family)
MTRTGIIAGLLAAAFATACDMDQKREANEPGVPATTAPGTTATAPGTTTTQAAAFDQMFIDHMAPHMEFGIDLAQVGQNNAQHEELKTYSENLVNTLKAEVDRMKDWRNAWFGSGNVPDQDNMPALTGVAPYDFRSVWTTTPMPSSRPMGTDGVGADNRPVGTDRTVTTPGGTTTTTPSGTAVATVENTPKGQLKALRDVDKANFDRAYLDTLVAWEQHNIAALRVGQSKAVHPEMKEHAGMLLDTAQRDLAQLEDWRNNWYGTGARMPAAGTK